LPIIKAKEGHKKERVLKCLLKKSLKKFCLMVRELIVLGKLRIRGSILRLAIPTIA
jgi:hypothetical protein